MPEQFLNKHNTRNFFNTPIFDYNCGGFALGTYAWYTPYYNQEEEYSVEDRIADIQFCLDSGMDEEEILESLIETDSESILKDFPELVRIYEDDVYRLAANHKIIAFREGIEILANGGRGPLLTDQDFHFKIRIGGDWYEKNGEGEIMRCELHPDMCWVGADISYSGPIVYFTTQ